MADIVDQLKHYHSLMCHSGLGGGLALSPDKAGMLQDAAIEIERLRAAHNEIVRIKDDTLGPRGGMTPLVGQEHFDRGCRMAFYRCAEISRSALVTEKVVCEKHPSLPFQSPTETPEKPSS